MKSQYCQILLSVCPPQGGFREKLRFTPQGGPALGALTFNRSPVASSRGVTPLSANGAEGEDPHLHGGSGPMAGRKTAEPAQAGTIETCGQPDQTARGRQRFVARAGKS